MAKQSGDISSTFGSAARATGNGDHSDLREELAALCRQLEHAHRLIMLGTMAAGVAHEINNLLTPALAYAQLAKANDGDTEFLKRSFEKTIGGASRAAEVAEAVLGLANPENRYDRAGQDEANVLEVCHDTLNCLPRDPSKDGIEIDMDVPLDLCVQMRPVALRQVLLNLVLNAIEAVRGSRDARITIAATDDDERGIRLDVSDNGPGIPPHMHNCLFDPFVTSAHQRDAEGHHKRKQVGNGIGLGLSICRLLVEAEGGDIELLTTSPEGTTFRIRLKPIDAEFATAASSDIEERTA